MTNLVICGGGNAAHVYAGIAASLDANVKVLTIYEDEAARWTKAMAKSDFVVSVNRGEYLPPKTVKEKPALVTKNPEEAFPNAAFVVITVPAYAHGPYLEALKPFVKPGLVIVGMPGLPGFEYEVWSILGDIADHCTIISTEALPWQCQIKEYGKVSEVLGTKINLMTSVFFGETPAPEDPVAALQSTLGTFPVLKVYGNLLGVSIMAPNACIRVPIMYGQWSEWDGKPVDSEPLFYQGVDEKTADLMTAVSDEAQKVRQAIEAEQPDIDLSNASSIYHWFLRCYGDDAKDKRNLYVLLKNNPAYDGVKHPMVKKGNKFLPDFTFRYMTEDVPYGLVVLRGIAEIAKVDTPTIDKILLWAQEKIGKQYLKGGKIKGKDIPETRCPQRYGFTKISQIFKQSKIPEQVPE